MRFKIVMLVSFSYVTFFLFFKVELYIITLFLIELRFNFNFCVERVVQVSL